MKIHAKMIVLFNQYIDLVCCGLESLIFKKFLKCRKLNFLSFFFHKIWLLRRKYSPINFSISIAIRSFEYRKLWMYISTKKPRNKRNQLILLSEFIKFSLKFINFFWSERWKKSFSKGFPSFFLKFKLNKSPMRRSFGKIHFRF